jgi:anti-anti-sigma factor
MTVVHDGSLASSAVLNVEGPLRAPVRSVMRHDVRALLRRGERRILVHLAQVSEIDAAGVGQLVRAYNMAVAANAVLRIIQVSTRVREVLSRVGLLDLLSPDSDENLTTFPEQASPQSR